MAIQIYENSAGERRVIYADHLTALDDALREQREGLITEILTECRGLVADKSKPQDYVNGVSAVMLFVRAFGQGEEKKHEQVDD